jgi:nucleotide-diphospho-sugar transferase
MNRFQDRANINKDEVILFLVSNGLSDFIQNAITSIRRCGVTTTICIALPRHALAEVKVAASGFQNVEYAFLEEISDFDYSAITEYFNYGSEKFSRFMNAKWRAIRFLLECGFARVIYTDVDVVWIRNPLPLLKQALQCFEMAIQTEGMESFPPEYCCGFMSFRNSNFVIGLLKQLEDLHLRALSNGSASDQAVFNRLVASSNDLLYRIHGLSELLFANGLNATRPSDNRDILVQTADPMIIHANWTIGLENKRLLLQRGGNWLIDQPAKCLFDKKNRLASASVLSLGPKSKRIAKRLLKSIRFQRTPRL